MGKFTNEIKEYFNQWETANIFVKDARLEEADVLQLLCEKSEYLRKWEGNPPIDPKHIEKTIIEGDLPPNGKKENFKIQSFYLKGTGQLVGYMTYYFGYPKEDIIFLNFLFIDPDDQGKGYSSEIVQKFMELVQVTPFNKVQLLVKLKNWPAIRFWTKHQFTTIIGYYGDAVHSDNTFAGLILEREVKHFKKE